MSSNGTRRQGPAKSQPGPNYAFISREGLKKLTEYKYVSGSYSFMDNVMTPFWNWFVTLIPMVSLSSVPCSLLHAVSLSPSEADSKTWSSFCVVCGAQHADLDRPTRVHLWQHHHAHARHDAVQAVAHVDLRGRGDRHLPLLDV